MERLNSGVGSSSIRRRSLSISSHVSHRTENDDDAESESVSEAGDIGDRALPSRRFSGTNSFRFSFDETKSDENGGTAADVEQLQPPRASSAIRPLPPQLVASPLSTTDAVLPSEEPKKETRKGLPEFLDYASCMIHMAVFGILGVLTRYLLQKLFGPGEANLTSNKTVLYLDLPANMIGSFLMGWFGVVFKADISQVSEHLAIAITTGYLGSLTTFSGWNQKMLQLSVSGHWLFAILGFLFGLFLVGYSIIVGIETAKGFKWLLNKLNMCSGSGDNSEINCRVDSPQRQLAAMTMFLVILGILWGVSGALVKAKFKNGGSGAELWFACMVGPVGVWIRWFLARLNGRGLGRAGLFKWMPFGTLIANVSAACVMAALSTVKEAVNTKDCDTIVIGTQLGLLGCLSTVSTFAAEFNAMRESNHPWRAYVYAVITMCASFVLGILIYCVPVWATGYDTST
ncbi:uncharacterized protein LOC130944253 [Arachis stenosperma]|uniref:uncharacterized protein LOC130944253 n=1 Tax=Arachis stenosperma TaxID=217475 RepID=UPI0025ABEEE0|nr:uncharacterized protein LOC130944253 [Arachis stenosperma]XP_057728467.1 uncharacterized protein LOC130944253 [Arachis stenosperma]XP_057728468.1 uncharacterized protein LOC130944253 [Arachis stenosperma]XP_057728469.1 uncharacterized protein LOC130944253 [Arachis stenosperma]